MKEGYGYRDLPNLKKKKKWSSLSENESTQINEYLENISKLPWVEAVELAGLEKEDLEMFSALTLEYHLDFADAFHIIIAMIENCKFLVTRDEVMREKASAFLKDNALEDDFEVVRPTELLNRF